MPKYLYIYFDTKNKNKFPAFPTFPKCSDENKGSFYATEYIYIVNVANMQDLGDGLSQLSTKSVYNIFILPNLRVFFILSYNTSCLQNTFNANLSPYVRPLETF